MLLAAASAAVAMLWFDGRGFSGSRGLPFAWYWWSDLSINNSPGSGYRWLGLIADVVIWLALIIGFGLLVDLIIQRLSRRRESTNAI